MNNQTTKTNNSNPVDWKGRAITEGCKVFYAHEDCKYGGEFKVERADGLYAELVRLDGSKTKGFSRYANFDQLLVLFK